MSRFGCLVKSGRTGRTPSFPSRLKKIVIVNNRHTRLPEFSCFHGQYRITGCISIFYVLLCDNLLRTGKPGIQGFVDAESGSPEVWLVHTEALGFT